MRIWTNCFSRGKIAEELHENDTDRYALKIPRSKFMFQNHYRDDEYTFY